MRIERPRRVRPHSTGDREQRPDRLAAEPSAHATRRSGPKPTDEGRGEMRSLMRVAGLIGLLLWPATSLGQDFPNHPIRFIVPFPAGGPSDVISRVLTAKMASLLGQPVVVENRAGAGGLTGIAYVARSEPDGYTIAIAPSSGLAMNVTLRADM